MLLNYFGESIFVFIAFLLIPLIFLVFATCGDCPEWYESYTQWFIKKRCFCGDYACYDNYCEKHKLSSIPNQLYSFDYLIEWGGLFIIGGIIGSYIRTQLF